MISDRIKELRENKGLSQRAFADAIDVTSGAVGMWESGKRTPNRKTAKKLADFFGVTVSYIMDEPEKTINPKDDLTEKEEKDVAKSMEKLKAQLQDGNDLYFDGEPMDEITVKLLLEEFERQERMVKTINRKYTPKKYRKE
ncbi:helix-turn-helix transcriptional regulator [Eubacterium sp.]|uniref:helix-turn-helix transcriptional regulator n=1 Tax=Eubacterium sp. TaxID=142586 RepID=UPI002FC724F9